MKANRAEEQTGGLEIVQWNGSVPRRKVTELRDINTKLYIYNLYKIYSIYYIFI